MAQQGVNVQLGLKEIYSALCPKCKEKIRQLIKDRVTDKMVDDIIGTA